MTWPEPDPLTHLDGDHLTMGYFDNLDNGFSNKYEINLKNRKKNFMDMLFYLSNSNFM
jgi:hypothetical protein